MAARRPMPGSTEEQRWERLFGVISKIELEQARMRQLVESNAETTRGLLQEHDRLLHGNGAPGLIVRVDRLEQTETNRRWHIRVLYAAVIAGVLDFFRRLVQ